MGAINNEPEEKQRPVTATGAADVVGSGSVQRSDMHGSAAIDRIETSAFYDVSGAGSGALIRMPEAEDRISAGDKVIDHSGDASPSALVASKYPEEDLVETPFDLVIDAHADTASSPYRVPGDMGSVTPPHTDLIENASRPLLESMTPRVHVETSLGSDPGPDLLAADSAGEPSVPIDATIQVCASAAHVPGSQTERSQSPDRGITATRQEPETEWIKELREAARLCEHKNEGQASDLRTILR